VRANAAGVHFGPSDPRKDGAAAPQSPAFFTEAGKKGKGKRK
jgi:hypothetical protein